MTPRLVTDVATDRLSEEISSSGVCAQTDPEVFFPERGQPNTAARRICAGCPVSAACLEWALRTGQTSGVWGGLSWTARRRLLAARQRRAVLCV